MNTLMLVALAVVALCYCGGRFCPPVLKQNKELVLGVLVGMALCSFAGLRMEGFENINACRAACPTIEGKCNVFWEGAVDCEGVRRAAREAEMREWSSAIANADANAEMERVDSLTPLPTLPPLRGGK
jgi:hypothetical protein